VGYQGATQGTIDIKPPINNQLELLTTPTSPHFKKTSSLTISVEITHLNGIYEDQILTS
jgi:hypothetical protein